METTMLSPDRITSATPLQTAATDYDVVRQAIGFISEQWREQPDVEAADPTAPRAAGGAL